MDERRANIDLAFRNGLKDYEVLPPPDAWNSISSGLATGKRRPAYLIRAAAFLAIAMTLSILAYRWIGTTSNMPQEGVLAANEESSSPLIVNNMVRPLTAMKETAASASHIAPATVDNQEVLSLMSPEDNILPSVEKLTETNIRMPFKTVSLSNSIQDHSGFQEEKQSTLALDDVSQEYQDYLANISSENKGSRWSIAALATPTYYGNINTGSDVLSKQIKASEQAVVSYSGGVALTYKLNKRLSIQSGLFYSSIGQEVTGINSFSGFQKYDNTKGDHNFSVLTANGIVTTNNADVFLFANGTSERIITVFNKDVFDPQKVSLEYINNNMRQNFSYLEMPVFLRYKLIDKTVDFNLIGGLSYNLLVENSVYTVVDGNKYMIGTTEGLNTLSISSSLGMGMEYNFSPKLSLNLEPTFRYYMNTFNNGAGSNFHPYSFGIFSGISYKF